MMQNSTQSTNQQDRVVEQQPQSSPQRPQGGSPQLQQQFQQSSPQQPFQQPGQVSPQQPPLGVESQRFQSSPGQQSPQQFGYAANDSPYQNQKIQNERQFSQTSPQAQGGYGQGFTRAPQPPQYQPQPQLQSHQQHQQHQQIQGHLGHLGQGHHLGPRPQLQNPIQGQVLPQYGQQFGYSQQPPQQQQQQQNRNAVGENTQVLDKQPAQSISQSNDQVQERTIHNVGKNF